MGGVELYLYTFLTSVLDGGEWVNLAAFPAWRHLCTCWIGGWEDFWGTETSCGLIGITALSEFFFVSFWGDPPPPTVGHDILIHEVSRSHNDAAQSVRLLWTSDQLIAETSSLQHTTPTADKLPCLRWDSNLKSEEASGRRPTPSTARPLETTRWGLEMEFKVVIEADVCGVLASKACGKEVTGETKENIFGGKNYDEWSVGGSVCCG